MASTRAGPARDAAGLEFKQTPVGHLVPVKTGPPRRYPDVLGGLLAPHRLMPLAQIQVKPFPCRLCQQRNRQEVVRGIHVLPPGSLTRHPPSRSTSYWRKRISHSSHCVTPRALPAAAHRALMVMLAPGPRRSSMFSGTISTSYQLPRVRCRSVTDDAFEVRTRPYPWPAERR